MRALGAPGLRELRERVHARARTPSGREAGPTSATGAGVTGAVRAALTAAIVALDALETCDDPWVDAADAPVPARAIRDAVRRGELRASRVAKRLLVRRSELDGWIERHAVTPPLAPERSATLLDRLGPRAPAEGASSS